MTGMEPVYMNMQPYPHQNGQVHYRPRCYPGMEGRPPMSYEGWPWGGNYGYPPPGSCHACCNHGHMPSHCAWGSPYPHVSPHHWPGNYPYVPVHYMPPPPYPVMDHPRYEYEKGVPMEHHCCGCRDHPVHQKEQRNVRIEEEEPEREKRKNDSLVPSQFKNSPYPIVWLPPDYNEGGKAKNAEGGKNASRDVEEHGNGKTLGQQPTSWNGWLPLDLSNVVSSKERGGGEENSHQDDGKRNVQFPFFWIPYKPHDPERESQPLKDGYAKLSLETEKGSGGDQNSHVNGGNAGDHSASRVKDIPVKEVEQHFRKDSSITGKEGEASVKIRPANNEKKIDNVERVANAEGSKRKSPSPPKSSKLPPVCLRVDPLPRKKSANAKSRSPSPPGDKQKPVVKSDEAAKVHYSEQVKESTDKKTIPVVDGSTSREKSATVNIETPRKPPAKSEDGVSMKQAEEKPQEEIAPNHSEGDAVNKKQSEDLVPTGGEKEESSEGADAGKKCNRRELSEEEAAVIIQSAYRLFDVRRWKPLEKLRQIARVREEIADVKSLIREMELNSDSQSRAKQKNIISETIMSLLLRLDTIQGLHPSIREVRKFVVKELVSLQEQLDTIMNEKLENSPGEESVMRQDQEDLSSKIEDVMQSENSNKINPVDLQNQTEGGPVLEREEFPEANPIGEAASVKLVADAAESYVDEGVKSSQGPTPNDVDEKNNEMLENDETLIDKEDSEPIILGKGSEISSLLDDSARATDSTQTEDHVQSELAELPQGVLDDLCAAEGTNHPTVEANSSKADQSTTAELPVGVLDNLHAAEDTNHPALEADSSKADQPQQLEEALTGSSTVEELDHENVNEEHQETTETHEVSDRSLNGYELEAEETAKGGSLESGMEESKASDERDLPTTGETIPTNEESNENTGITDTATEEPPTEKEMSGQLLREGNMEETCLTNDEHTNSCDAASMAGVESAAAAKSSDATANICIVEQDAADINHSEGGSETGRVLSKHSEEECNPLPKGLKTQEMEDAAEHEEENNAVGDETKEKLMEEKERLREMVEQLIKTGQEQLTAISSLSGRVKELEKRLSRKKKLKMKQFRAPKSFDSYGAVGVAM